MKLIDILIAADFEWGERYGFAAQDSNGMVWAFLTKPRLRRGPKSVWVASNVDSFELAADLADDWSTSVITREEYLAAREAAKPKGHPHAALMAEYAEVARTNPEPWREFECKNKCAGMWHTLTTNPSWIARIEYRRKPRTIRIGDYDVPEPVRESLEDGQVYFAVALLVREDKVPAYKLEWEGDLIDIRLLEQGRIHLTKEAAELHAKALLSFTKQKGESQ